MWIWVGFASTNFLSPVRKTSSMTELYDSYKIIIDFIDIENCILPTIQDAVFIPLCWKNKTQCQTIFVMDCLLAFYDIKGSHEINYESTND